MLSVSSHILTESAEFRPRFFRSWDYAIFVFKINSCMVTHTSANHGPQLIHSVILWELVFPTWPFTHFLALKYESPGSTEQTKTVEKRIDSYATSMWVDTSLETMASRL